MKPCLFISYDGLLDPLGTSQIIPYLQGIAKQPRPVFILSFEKPEKYRHGAYELKKALLEQGIVWQPLLFSRRFSYLGKAWDLLKMYAYSGYLIQKHQIKIIHARGHTPAQVGLFWKKKLACKLLFDFRGLWVDERVDKGGWNLSRKIDGIFFKYFKRQEKKLIQAADHLVVLTEAVIPELTKLGLDSFNKVSVIPCCADFEHFNILSQIEKKQERALLNIPYDALVFGYIGSVGPMYLIHQFFEYIEKIFHLDSNAYALIVTPDLVVTEKALDQFLPQVHHHRVRLLSAKRHDMPKRIGVMDVMLSFIKPGYARLATSPTKIAESLACGVPVISNEGIGDVTQILKNNHLGFVIDKFLPDMEMVQLLKTMNAMELRARAMPILDLKRANQSYHQVYLRLQRDKIC